MDNTIIVSISKDFSITPGSRYRVEGDHSGEEFRETILEPKFDEAEKQDSKIKVILDGGMGYGTSFLEEAFGGLARKYDSEKVLNRLTFISEEEPYLVDDIIEYIKDANN